MNSLASSVLALVGVAARRAPGLPEGEHIPRIEVERRVVVEAGWLRSYRVAVGAVNDGCLPPCAAQALAIGLHLQILSDRKFPLPALGIVHIDNRIDELRALKLPAPAPLLLTVRAFAQGERRSERGIEFDITTEVHDEQGLAWRSVLSALVLAKKRDAPDRKKREPEPTTTTTTSSVVRVPADMGRRFCRIAGDANPIHLTALTAKAFGFPRAIAHGMWTLGRALAEVDDLLPPRPRRIDARFIRPVFLPGSIVIDGTREGATTLLRVHPERGGAPHLIGRISAL